MTEHDPIPGVISYVDYYDGPLRVLTLELVAPGLGAATPPVVSIDGRQFIVVWGTVSLEIPTTRNVHVSVHLEGEAITSAASLILPPGQAPLTYRYRTHYGMAGELTLAGA